jgi:hypothetical protein
MLLRVSATPPRAPLCVRAPPGAAHRALPRAPPRRHVIASSASASPPPPPREDYAAPPVRPGDAADDADAAAWADDEECRAVFEVDEVLLRELCHTRATPPACSHDYWRARGWRARPRDWERYAGTRWEVREAWPPACVADDAGEPAALAAGSERARAAFAAAVAAAEAASEGEHDG